MKISKLHHFQWTVRNVLAGKVSLTLLIFILAYLQALFACAAQKGQMVKEPVFNSTVYVEEHGKQNKLTVVLVHGTGELGARIWDSTIEELKDSFHILTFDLPGFGRSEKKNALYSPAKYARFLDWIVRQYSSKPVYIIGHSLGGAIALYYAGIFPDRLDRLILVDAAGILHRSSFTKNVIDQQLSGEVKVGEKDIIKKPLSVFKYLVGTTIENVDKALVPDDMSPLLNSETFRKTALNGDPIRISGMALIHTDFGPILDKVRVPTVIIWGEHDDIAPLRTGKLLAYRIDKSSFSLLNSLQHNPMLEDPETFNSLLLESIIDPTPEPYLKIETSLLDKEKPSSRQFTNHTDLKISGYFKNLTIKGGKNIKLTGVVARYIEIEDSEVEMENTRVTGEDIGVQITNSIAHITGVNIAANTAIRVYNSNVDIAGSRLQGKHHLIQSERKSTIIFSVCKVQSPDNSGHVHKVISLNLGESF